MLTCWQVLPPVTESATNTAKAVSKTGDSPVRRFSKRGVRLAVHSSILDMNAHEAPVQLKNKWIQTSRDHSHQRKASLSKITEVDPPQSDNGLRQIALGYPVSGNDLKGIASDTKASKQPLQRNLPSTTVEYSSEEDASKKEGEAFPKRGPSLKIVTAPLRKIMHRLSISHETMVEANKGTSRLSVRSFQKPPLTTPDYEKEFENGV
jgi:hypothetical protein